MGEQGPLPPGQQKAINERRIAAEIKHTIATRKEVVLSAEALAAGKELAKEKENGKCVYINNEIIEKLKTAIRDVKNVDPSFRQTEAWVDAFIAREIAKEIEEILIDDSYFKSLLYDPIINITDPKKIIEILQPKLIKYYKDHFKRQKEESIRQQEEKRFLTKDEIDLALLKQLREERLKKQRKAS